MKYVLLLILLPAMGMAQEFQKACRWEMFPYPSAEKMPKTLQCLNAAGVYEDVDVFVNTQKTPSALQRNKDRCGDRTENVKQRTEPCVFN